MKKAPKLAELANRSPLSSYALSRLVAECILKGFVSTLDNVHLSLLWGEACTQSQMKDSGSTSSLHYLYIYWFLYGLS